MNFGNNLIYYRKKLGITQEELAQKLGELPSSQKNARFLQRIFISGAADAELPVAAA